MFFEKHKTAVIIAVISLVLIILMGTSTIPTKNAFVVNNVVRTVVQPLQNGVSYIISGVGGFFGFLFDVNDYKAENDRLTAMVAELERKYRSAEDYRIENERLSALLDVKTKAIADLPSVGARIIGWSANNWFDYYTIDKGSLDGVKKRDMVVTEDGLVGHVYDVGLNWAQVTTVINSSSSAGVRVVRSGDIAIVEGDMELEKKGLCKMTFVNKDAQIAIGDVLETSGLGGLYASGVAIGKVTEIKTDVTGVSQYALVEPLVDLKKIHTVLVILSVE